MSFHKLFQSKRNNDKNLIQKFLSWYSTKLQTHPITTKAFTSGFIAGAGDITCQYIIQRQLFINHNHYNTNVIDLSEHQLHQQHGEQEKERMTASLFAFQPDLIRTSRFTILGFGLIAPVVHQWYGFLMRNIPGTNLSSVVKRTFIDQFCFSPLFIPTFMTSLLTLESKSKTEIYTILCRDYLDVLVTNWSIWTPAMMINFKFVPGPWQVLFSNCVGFIWNVYLSWKTQEYHGGGGGGK